MTSLLSSRESSFAHCVCVFVIVVSHSIISCISVFSIQPTLSTREKQLEDWSRLVIDYAQHNKVNIIVINLREIIFAIVVIRSIFEDVGLQIYTIDLVEAASSPLFNNSKLNRRLDSEGIKLVFANLEAKSEDIYFENTIWLYKPVTFVT